MGCSHSKNNVRSSEKSDPSNTNLTLDESEIRIVQDTWPAINEQKEVFGVFIFNSFLAQETHMRRFFPRLVIEDGQLTFRADASAVKAHALRVVDGIKEAVECVHDKEKLHKHLNHVGLRHADVGVRADLMPKLYPAIDNALKVVLKDNYNQDVRHAWRKFFFHIIEIMNRQINEMNKQIEERIASLSQHSSLSASLQRCPEIEPADNRDQTGEEWQ